MRAIDDGHLHHQQVGHAQPAGIEGKARQAVLQRQGLEVAGGGTEPGDLCQPVSVFGCDQDLEHVDVSGIR
ncbi:hypothetical protein D9M72_590130 [compost metagenome]